MQLDLTPFMNELQRLSSHSYDEAKARQVSDLIPEFVAEAQFLLSNLQQRYGAVS
jgi:hypothetical protein